MTPLTASAMTLTAFAFVLAALLVATIASLGTAAVRTAINGRGSIMEPLKLFLAKISVM